MANGDSGDRVMGTALDVFALLVSRDPRDLIDLANRGNLIPALFQRLGTMTRKNDPLFTLNGAENDIELRRRGFGRTDKTPVRSPWTTLSFHGELISLTSSVTSTRLSLGPAFFPKGRR